MMMFDDPWRRYAECATADHNLFFPERGASTAQAKAMCGRCPVRIDCLEHSIFSGEQFGLWGGLAERNRRKVKHLMARKGMTLAEALKVVEK